MASKQHIKETINALCKIIIYNGGTRITPEQFRLAKFDKIEVTGAMWKLLFETVCYVKFNTFRTAEQNRDTILWTKYELFKMGYYVKEFYDLPEDMSFGSRDILLAFGWLMSKSKLLRLFLDNCNNILEECLPVDWELLIGPSLQHSSKSTKESERISSNFEHRNEETLDVHKLSWMIGHLTLTFKGLFTAENQLASLVNKVHLATQGVDAAKGHLSALEVFLLRHPKELTKFLEKIQHYNAYLESLLKFIEMNDVFWKWMESVNEVKVFECKDKERLGWNTETSCKTCCAVSNKTFLGVLNAQTELEKVIDEIEKQTKTGYAASSSNDVQSLGQVKLQELDQRLQSLTLHKKYKSKQSNVETFPELKHCITSVKQSEQSCVQQEIHDLKLKLSEVELKLTELRNEHFAILNDLVGNLQDSVLIPPIGNAKYTELRNK